MRGEGMSRDCSQPGPPPGKRTLRPCKMKENFDNVVVIDVDESDGYDGVFIIDVPKGSKKGADVRDSMKKQKFGPSHVLRERNRVLFEGTIHIDDEDDDGTDSCYECDSDSSEDDGQDLGVNDMPSTSAPSKVQKSAAVDASDDCEFIGFGVPTRNFSRCRARYADESCSRNRYGYYPDLSDSYESDSSDCEILDGSRGNPREQWEEAFKRKKKSHACKDQSDVQDRDGYGPEIARYPNSGPATESTQKADQDSVPGCPHSTSAVNASPHNKAGVCLGRETVVEDHNSGLDKCGSPNQDSSRVHDPSLCKDGLWQDLVNSTFVPKSKETRGYDTTASKGKMVTKKLHLATQDKPETLGSGGQRKRPLAELIRESHHSDDNNAASSSSPEDASLCQGNIINEREKMKETAEYKRAIEEEWEARQQQLQIQAEEAQRLRKRKKAEALRILDMQRRQKQRLEEVRETQKKDEENLNTKEKLRGEVRKELSLLESRCINLASVLRSLGITVGGGFRPASHEVHAAYKRALLKFHPDRASRTDIRQQVEAEEKFKLISRMKEKLFPASLC